MSLGDDQDYFDEEEENTARNDVENRQNTIKPSAVPNVPMRKQKVQAILFEIDCAIFFTNLHELFCLFISWRNWVNSGKFMENYWISCQVMVDMKKVYDS